MTDDQTWDEFFPEVHGYLNTATVGIPPNNVVPSISEVLERWRVGRLSAAEFDPFVDSARTAWASIAGVPATQVAIGSAASPLVGLVAAALPAGAQVLVGEGDFTSVLFPLLAQQRRGVRVREVPLSALVESVDDSVDLIAVSAVQSSDGRIVDVEALAAAADAHCAQVLLDVTQSCGWLPLDLTSIDYAVCSAYKWLLCPRGVAFMSVRADRLEAITPHAAGWYAGRDIWASIYGSPLRLAANARRLDTSPAWFCWIGAAHALQFLAGQDAQGIYRHDVGLADAFLNGLGQPEQHSAIVSINVPGAEEALAAARISTAVRDGRVRASFHLYNDAADVAAAVQALSGESLVTPC